MPRQTHSRTHRSGGERLPLDTARDTFTALVTGPDPLSVNGRLFGGLPEGRIPLDDLRDRLMRRGCPRRTRDAVWAHLVLRSRLDGATWTVACVGVALPGLATLASWIADRYPGDRADVHAEVLAGFLHALPTVDLRAPAVLGRLRWAARRAGMAALQEALDAPVPVPPGRGSAPPAPPAGHPDLVLARAVADGVLSRTEADVIGATRLEEVRLTAWAAEHRMEHQFASRLRARAETRLLGWLTDTPDTTPPRSQPVTDAEGHRVVAGWLAPAPGGAVLAVWRHPDGRIRWRACGSEPAARTVLAGLGITQIHTSPTGPAGRAAAKPAQKVPARLRETAPKTGLLECGGSTPTAPPVPGSSSEATRCA